MDRSRMRYTVGGFLFAIGLLVSLGSAAAVADTGAEHTGGLDSDRPNHHHPAAPLAQLRAVEPAHAPGATSLGNQTLGFCGFVFLTAGGGVIGYRQAKAGHWGRSRGVERFLH